ncbi:MAG: hypothetical protein QOG77_418 [Solirubrobacteraceae bacterium]|jgi:hypothetical protein|nr:hypothetical protein [Solirubrobacteraceae bacterium]
MTGPVEPEPSSARAWFACGLVLLGATVLVVGLLALGDDATGSLALVVAPAVVLVAAGAAVAR